MVNRLFLYLLLFQLATDIYAQDTIIPPVNLNPLTSPDFRIPSNFTQAPSPIPAYFNLRERLTDSGFPIRDARLELKVTIREKSGTIYGRNQYDKIVFEEIHSDVKTNYDGFISIKVGGINALAFGSLNWQNVDKIIQIESRIFNTRDPFKINYEDKLPVAAFAQIARPSEFTKPSGAVQIYSDNNHPNIELRGKDGNVTPYIDFSNSNSNDYGARIILRKDTMHFDSPKGTINMNSEGGFILSKGSLYVKEGIEVDRGVSVDGGLHVNSGVLTVSGKTVLSNTLEVSGKNDFSYSRDTFYNYLTHRQKISRNGNNNAINWNQNALGWMTLGPNSQTSIPFSIHADGRVLAEEYMAFSDARIKINQGQLDQKSSLDIISKLQVKDYSYVDKVQHGNIVKTGFFAQEVETVLPEAVTRVKEVIPDIFQASNGIAFDENTQTVIITLDSICDVKAGDKIQVLGEKPHLVEVAAVNNNDIHVKNWPEQDTKEVFVYGKEVDDFRVVDYDRIFTLNVSATQALIQEMAALRKEVSELQALNKGLETENTSLKKILSSLESRVSSIEKQLSSSSTSSAGSH